MLEVFQLLDPRKAVQASREISDAVMRTKRAGLVDTIGYFLLGIVGYAVGLPFAMIGLSGMYSAFTEEATASGVLLFLLATGFGGFMVLCGCACWFGPRTWVLFLMRWLMPFCVIALAVVVLICQVAMVASAL